MFRYSIRLALAMMAGAVVAQFLGDSGHGNWVLLTIAVIMRSNYGMTKSRRDDRVIGTLIGCVVAAGAVAWMPARTLVAVQGLAVVVIHSFVDSNYRLSSVGASVMALVSLHLIQPHLPAPVARAPRRHADRRRDRASVQLRLAVLGVFRRAQASQGVCWRGSPHSPTSR